MGSLARFLATSATLGLVVASAIVAERRGPKPEVARWFIPGPIGHEPGCAPDAVQAGARGFMTRSLGGLRGAAADEWAKRNDLTSRLAFSHNLTRVFPVELYKTHPEFFPYEKGRRIEPRKGSYFWQADLAREDVAHHAAEAARAYFNEHPEQPSFALGINDGLIWGESPELVALAAPPRWFRERPDYSNVVFTFMNRAAENLSRTHPDKYVGALAYYWCENTPDFPVHPQVIPFLTADRSQGYDKHFWQEEMALQEQWGKIAGRPAAQRGEAGGRRLGLYDYLYGYGFLIPRIHTELLAKHLRHAWRSGFTDYYAEIFPNWGLDGITPWLTAQLLQDPEQSPEALLDEYYRRYFREAAEPMRRFHERCEEQWMQQPGPAYWLKHYRSESQAIVFPSAVCRELRTLLDDAASRATTAATRQRVAFVSAAFGATERFIACKEARDRVLTTVLAREPDLRQAEAQLADYLQRRREFIRYTIALQRDEPLALAPFRWTDYLMNDPVPLVLTHLAGRGSLDPALAGEPMVNAMVEVLRDSVSSGELLRDPGLNGELQTPREMAGLMYGVPVPAGWVGKVEPAQHHRAEVRSSERGRVIRLTGTKDTRVFQWVRLTGKGLDLAEMSARGHVSPGTSVTLDLAWLDEKEQHISFKVLRLPDGEWPDWVTLRQAGFTPANAVWVGLGLRVSHQVPGDWIELRGFSLQQRRRDAR